MIIPIALLLFIGIAFNALGAVSLYRFPDVYTRLHGTTKCTTFGSIFSGLGVILYGVYLAFSGDGSGMVMIIHTVVALVALLITNPTGSHAIARAAHRSGIKPKQAVVDRLAEDRGAME